MNKKRVMVISDLHCGHRVGLTPPDYQYSSKVKDRNMSKSGKLQKEMWKWYKKQLEHLGHIDVLIVNGDAIDGKGKRSGGTELITSDLHIQSDMATECINQVDAKKIFMTYGTPYHTGESEDIEDIIAKNVGASIKGQHFISVNNTIFDVKHKTGSSNSPHARATAVSRDALWNEIWSNSDNGQPKADIVIRSHVHYYNQSGDHKRLGMTTPALQGFGSKFGVRQCSGIVDIGFVVFDVYGKNKYEFQPYIFTSDLLKSKLTKVV